MQGCRRQGACESLDSSRGAETIEKSKGREQTGLSVRYSCVDLAMCNVRTCRVFFVNV